MLLLMLLGQMKKIIGTIIRTEEQMLVLQVKGQRLKVHGIVALPAIILVHLYNGVNINVMKRQQLLQKTLKQFL